MNADAEHLRHWGWPARRRGRWTVACAAALAGGMLVSACAGAAPGRLSGTVSWISRPESVQPPQLSPLPPRFGRPSMASFSVINIGPMTVELVAGTRVVARYVIFEGDRFRFTAPAGSYRLRVAGVQACHGTATVEARTTTSATITCD